jgi:PAS domain S-box-containing protein
VLVAEDDPLFRELVMATLPPDLYTVLEAPDGDVAWALLLAHRPRLAILDVRMPGHSGLELVRLVRAEPALADTRLILLTGLALTPQDVAAGVVAGADAYLTKPFSPLRLLGTVEGLLERQSVKRRLTDELYWSLVEHAPLALLVIDARTGRYVAVNAAAEQLLGRSRLELLHLQSRDITPPEDWVLLAQARTKLEAEGTYVGPCRLVHADGHVIETEAHASRVATGEGVFFQGYFRALDGPP